MPRLCLPRHIGECGASAERLVFVGLGGAPYPSAAGPQPGRRCHQAVAAVARASTVPVGD
jgi:hypothetical protein